ncbi:hypothetical protein MJO47_02430 [Desulfuromonas sp. KJ2020]|uniref:hypothetical protein n=1 Tax=Desulfuromonas sp. KJ2020 TaxID=2919173 RepID=UPI0020A7B932|nr:hypothetical protein [Desulfuromonas sp. KJ2020]MCP3175947.1 hypothetical protein [Desulfuromonas sp. KJ2020]
MKYTCLILFVLILGQTPAFGAKQMENLGAITPTTVDDFHKVIDNRCGICHSRERVDVAIAQRRSLEKLQQQMIERGAVLDPRDKEVLGTFWGRPFAGEDKPAPQPVH